MFRPSQRSRRAFVGQRIRPKSKEQVDKPRRLSINLNGLPTLTFYDLKNILLSVLRFFRYPSRGKKNVRKSCFPWQKDDPAMAQSRESSKANVDGQRPSNGARTRA
jgi:hypothetical protein